MEGDIKMAEFDIESTIQELNRIDDLYSEKTSLYRNLNGGIVAELKEESDRRINEFVRNLENYQKIQKEKFGAETPSISKVCKINPPPVKNKDKTQKINTCSLIWIEALSNIVCLASLVIFILAWIFNIGVIAGSFLILAIVSGLCIGGIRFIGNSDHVSLDSFINFKEQERKWQESFNTYDIANDQKRFFAECVPYEKRFNEIVNLCTDMQSKELKECQKALDNLRAEYLAKGEKDQSQLEIVEEKLGAVTLIHSDLFCHAWRISEMLETQRADTLKDAINLALEEERKENEEAERRAEARRQEAILEEQAYMTRMHEQAMERATEEHNRAMEKEARRQSDIMKAQMEANEKRAEEQNKALKSRCGFCKKGGLSGTCPMRYNPPAYCNEFVQR